MTANRYDFDPIDALIPPGVDRARYLRASGTTVKLWQASGLSEATADRLATMFGQHPYELWPEMAEHHIEAVSKPCRRCGTLFVPDRSTAKWCSASCRSMAATAKHRATEAGRLDNQERARRYRQEHRDYVVARDRRYYAANAERMRQEARDRRARAREAA